jgi:Protein of unknown function, DUF481
MFLPARAAAQQPRLWRLAGEIGASVFFGASSQTAILTKGRIDRKDPKLEYSAGAGFEYGEASDPDKGSWVNKRSWTAETSLDYAPQGKWSPFLSLTAEGSLQKKIDLRTAGGAGVRYKIVESEQTRVDLSVALLAERTDPRVEPGQVEEIKKIGRWSGRFRTRHTFAGTKATFDMTTFYKPRVDDMRDYTLDLDVSTAYALTSIVALKVSLVDRYDSLATDRGARSNNDGRFFVSLAASIR